MNTKDANSPKKLCGKISGKGQKHALLVSRWNSAITDSLLKGAKEGLATADISSEAIHEFYVPGAFELGPTALLIAKSGRYDAITCLGCVIRGETEHFEYVSTQSARLIAQAAYDTAIPIIFGVLTTNTIEQAQKRAGMLSDNKMDNKGYESARAAIDLVNLYKTFKESK